jgi:hypothetical protein
MEKLTIIIIVVLLAAIVVLLLQLKKCRRIVFLLSSESRRTTHPNFLIKLGTENLKKFEKQIKEKYILSFNLRYTDVFPEEISRLTRHFKRLQKQKRKQRVILESIFFNALSENDRSLAFIIFSLEKESLIKRSGEHILFKNFLIQNIHLLGKEKIREITFRINFLNGKSDHKDKIDELILLIKQKSPA